MQMLTIICREQYEDEVLAVFDALKITGYTVIHGVGGSGETGAVSITHPQHHRNKLLLVALEPDRMAGLIKAIKELQAQLVREQSGYPVPFKAFLQPCEMVL
ncbi:MAG: hypothetical protein KF814_00535 [Nitrospiraceae bacterium]|nr:hypothetical protein [Nitrospiraceae bacterium]